MVAWMSARIRKLLGQDHSITLIFLTAAMALYYAGLLTNFRFDLFRPTENGLTFNSMLQHLLNGRFDVDSQAVGDEGFLRDGKVYAYWGIFCALIRLPLLLFTHGAELDVTSLSCLIAVTVALAVKVKTALLVRRHCPSGPTSELLFALLLAYIALGSAQVGFLKPSIFQEVVFWAATVGAAFVYCSVRGIICNHFSAGLLGLMALLSGIALLTRVSTGIGLYLATGLLLITLIAIEVGANRVAAKSRLGVFAAFFSQRVLLSGAILACFIVIAGIVNYYRWGHVETFADYSLYLGNRQYPDRLPRLETYGLFRLSRIPFGLIYFFVPVWVLQGADGRMLLESQQTRLIDVAELPPSSFLITDVIALVFGAFAIISLFRPRASRSFSRELFLPIAAGLAVPGVLMLTAISMTYRYRMEFYPELDLCAFLGFFAATRNATALEAVRRHRSLFIAATVVTIVSAHGALLLYKASQFGPAQAHLGAGESIAAYYGRALATKADLLRSHF